MKILQQLLTLSAILFACCAPAVAAEETRSSANLKAGVGIVDITPTEPASLAGSPTPLKSSSISSRLYARALVLSDGRQKAVIVTLDTLKYPVEHTPVRRGPDVLRAVPLTKRGHTCAPKFRLIDRRDNEHTGNPA